MSIARRLVNIDYYREYDRQRGKLPHRKLMYDLKNKRKHKLMGPNYARSHNALLRAVAAGKVVRPQVCSVCNKRTTIQAHHDDYTKPLSVIWLCPPCHAQRHVMLAEPREGAAAVTLSAQIEVLQLGSGPA